MAKKTQPRTAPSPPAPQVDPDSEAYWTELRSHRIQVRACLACGRRRLLPTPSCPYCGDPRYRAETSTGTGTIYSFITVHRAFDPAFVDEVPYAVATIDLDDGARALGRIVGKPAIGARVTPEFVDHSTWTELRFEVRPA